MNGIIDVVHMNLGKLWEMVEDREAWPAAGHRVVKSQIRLSDSTTTKSKMLSFDEILCINHLLL